MNHHPAGNPMPTWPCEAVAQEGFWLRPTATFERTGPHFPGGTAFTITGNPVAQNNGLTLFPVRVGASSGWAAFSSPDGYLNPCRGRDFQRGVGMASFPSDDNRPALCTLTSRTVFWLRPSATFAQQGPQFPAGTRVEVLAGPVQTLGNLALFAVRVGTQTGFAALSPAEVSACPQAQRFTPAAPTASYDTRPASFTDTGPAPATPGSTPSVTMTPIPTPASSTITPHQPAPAQGSGGPGVLCTVQSKAQFWLRPTATFDRVGPNFPSGTTVHILSPASGTSGTLTLYRARVVTAQGAQEGFVAMNASEVSTCGANIRAGAQAPAPPGALDYPGSRPPPTLPAPPGAPPPASPLATIRPSDATMSTGTKVVIAATGTVVLGALIFAATRKPRKP